MVIATDLFGIAKAAISANLPEYQVRGADGAGKNMTVSSYIKDLASLVERVKKHKNALLEQEPDALDIREHGLLPLLDEAVWGEDPTERQVIERTLEMAEDVCRLFEAAESEQGKIGAWTTQDQVFATKMMNSPLVEVVQTAQGDDVKLDLGPLAEGLDILWPQLDAAHGKLGNPESIRLARLLSGGAVDTERLINQAAIAIAEPGMKM